jgi:hypothetical protein
MFARPAARQKQHQSLGFGIGTSPIELCRPLTPRRAAPPPRRSAARRGLSALAAQSRSFSSRCAVEMLLSDDMPLAAVPVQAHAARQPLTSRQQPASTPAALSIAAPARERGASAPRFRAGASTPSADTPQAPGSSSLISCTRWLCSRRPNTAARCSILAQGATAASRVMLSLTPRTLRTCRVAKHAQAAACLPKTTKARQRER